MRLRAIGALVAALLILDFALADLGGLVALAAFRTYRFVRRRLP